MGSLISGDALRRLVSRVVSGAPDLNAQLGENGLDLTLMSVERFEDAGAIDFDNSGRRLSKTERLEFGEDGWLHLKAGAYKIKFNEIVRIPKDVVALTLPRSSLLRCGVSVESAVWDAGYEGRGEVLLVVHNPNGFYVKKDSRIAQMIFIRCSEPVDKGYSGAYQGVV